jgi:hypothetical protein
MSGNQASSKDNKPSTLPTTPTAYSFRTELRRKTPHPPSQKMQRYQKGPPFGNKSRLRDCAAPRAGPLVRAHTHSAPPRARLTPGNDRRTNPDPIKILHPAVSAVSHVVDRSQSRKKTGQLDRHFLREEIAQRSSLCPASRGTGPIMMARLSI